MRCACASAWRQSSLVSVKVGVGAQECPPEWCESGLGLTPWRRSVAYFDDSGDCFGDAVRAETKKIPGFFGHFFFKKK